MFNLRSANVSGCLGYLAVGVALVTVLLFPLAGPALAQTGPVMEVRAGFDGYVNTAEGWVPLQVTLANDGPDVEGVVRLRFRPSNTMGMVSYERAVSLPTHSRKRVWLYAPAVAMGTGAMVEWVVDGRVAGKVQDEFDIVRPRDYLVGVVSAEPSAFNLLRMLPVEKGARLRLAALTPDDLPPEGRAWEALDALIVHDPDWSRWDAARLEALRNWLLTGGHLVVASGPAGLPPAPAELADLSPLLSGGGAEVLANLPTLAAYTGAPLASAGPFVAARTVSGGGEVLLQEGETVLLARRTPGAGVVDVLALDPALEPLRGWTGSEVLWDRILDPLHASRPRLLVETLTGDPAGLYDLPNLGLPSVWQLILFLLVYILTIGPVNYLALWRLRRRELAWFTIPAIALFFTGLAYVTGFRLRGGRVIIYEMNIIHTTARAAGSAEGTRSVAAVESFVGVFSPRRAAYQVELPGVSLVDVARSGRGGSVAQARLDQTITEGDPTLLPDVRVDVGAVRSFRAATYQPWTPLEADLSMTAALTPTSARTWQVVGDIRNPGDVDLGDCVLIYQGDVYSLGDLAPGQSQSVKRTFLAPAQPGSTPGAVPAPIPPPGPDLTLAIVGGSPWSNPDLRARHTTLTTLFGWDNRRWQPIWDDLYLICWAEAPVVQAQATGRAVERRQTSLVLVRLPYHSE